MNQSDIYKQNYTYCLVYLIQRQAKFINEFRIFRVHALCRHPLVLTNKVEIHSDTTIKENKYLCLICFCIWYVIARDTTAKGQARSTSRCIYMCK